MYIEFLNMHKTKFQLPNLRKTHFNCLSYFYNSEKYKIVYKVMFIWQ